MSAVTAPTGQQFEISAAGYRAVITEVGATLRELQIDGKDIVAGFGQQARVEGGRGQQLMPWPNRIRDGRYSFGGQNYQLPVNETERGTALHGLVRWVPWQLVEHSADGLTQQVVVYPQQGWDSTIVCTVTHRLAEDGLTVTVGCQNVGDRAIPFGYAAHPYFTLGEQQVDDIDITVPASAYLEVEPDRLLPIKVGPVDGRPEDLRSGGPLGDRVFDTAFTDLEFAPSTSSASERWQIRLGHADRETVIWGDDRHRWIQLYTGADRRDLGLAIEAMTCGPDAFNTEETADGLVILEPGADYSGQWGVFGH
jgi:aldose 1-epimerase